MMTLNSEQFYLKCGVRTEGQLKNPHLLPYEALTLPIQSAYHYKVDGSIETEPSFELDINHPVIKHSPRQIVLDPITNYSLDTEQLEGHPRHLMRTDLEFVRNFKQHKDKTILLTKAARSPGTSPYALDVSLSQNPRDVRVFHYGLVEHHYVYLQKPLTHYHRWVNLAKTLVDTMAQDIDKERRNQYVEFEVPTNLIARSILKHIEANGFGVVHARAVKDPAQFTVMSIWLWLGGKQKTVWDQLTDEQLSSANIIWTAGGHFSVMNLGVLKTLMHDKGVKPEVMQQNFLYYILRLKNLETQVMGEQEEQTDVEAPSGQDVVPTDMTGGFKKKAMQKIDTDSIKLTKEEEEAEEADETDEDDNALLEEQLNQLEALVPTDHEEVKTYKPYSPKIKQPHEGVIQAAADLAAQGRLTSSEFNRFVKLAERPNKIKDPWGGKETLVQLAQIPDEELHVDPTKKMMEKIPGVVEESLLCSSHNHMTKQYIEKVLKRDVVGMMLGIQKCGIAIANYSVQRIDTLNDSLEIHSIQVQPPVGRPTTLRLEFPVLKPDGSFKVNGVHYTMRAQWTDVPIRKVKPDRVSLTSYYSKMFVARSELAAFSPSRWVLGQISQMVVAGELGDVAYADTSGNHGLNSPMYQTFSGRFSGFVYNGTRFCFDANRRFKALGLPEDYKEPKHTMAVAKREDGTVLFLTGVGHKAGVDQLIGTIDGVENPYGGLIEYLGLNPSKVPVPAADLVMLSKNIPIGFVLAHHMGLGTLIETVKASVRRVKRGSNYKLEAHEYMVLFEDEALIFDSRQAVPTLLFNGLNRYHAELKKISVYQMDKPDVYGPIAARYGLESRFLREWGLMFDLWVDSVTESILKDMKEPTDLVGLFLRAVELVSDDRTYPIEQRHRRYERFAGIAFGEVVKAIRSYRARGRQANASVDLKHRAVLMAIMQDQTTTPVEMSNPIHQLKEQEVTAFRGSGGQSSRSMTADARLYEKEHFGVISEATVDNGDVATIAYTVANPQYNSVRGTWKKRALGAAPPSSTMCTSNMLVAGADRDSPARANFTSIQNSATTFSVGYQPMPLRTGYERVMAHRVGELYAATAKGEGVVKEINKHAVVVSYKDGTTGRYAYGRQFGVWSGHNVPHDIKPFVKPGQKLKQGDPIIYNSHYFTPDRLDPKQILFKWGVLARVALMEINETFEDSCLISEQLSKKLLTRDTTIRKLQVEFNQTISDLIAVGTEVTPESILCTIYEAPSGASGLFDEASAASLKRLSQNNPRAKYHGKVEKIEIVYTGDLEDMSESLRDAVQESDARLYAKCRALGEPTVDGRVPVGYRVDGKSMASDTAVIKVYITHDVEMGAGDKLVVCNQMKSIVARRYDTVHESLDGTPVDLIFSYQSMNNRIVESAILIGTTNLLAKHLTQQLVKAWKG